VQTDKAARGGKKASKESDQAAAAGEVEVSRRSWRYEREREKACVREGGREGDRERL
jgi:hypothetical protein